MTPEIPRQKLSRREKTEKWQRECVDAYINQSAFGEGGVTIQSKRRDLIEKCYKYYNGIIDDEDYTHVTKPYGKERGEFPAKMHNYPLISPTINLLLGEKSKRPLNYSVTVTNGDVVTKKAKALQEHLTRAAEQQFVNALNEQGIQTGVPSKETPGLEETREEFEKSYRDERAIRGQKALSYIENFCELRRKFGRGWFHFLVAGEAYSKKSVVSGEPVYEMLNPLDVDYDKSPDTVFVEDGDWAIHRQFSLPSLVVDHFYESLTPEQIERLETPKNEINQSFFVFDDEGSMRDASRLIEVIHVEWKSRKKIGFLTYFDEFGMLQEREVDESYKPNRDAGEEVEWKWINCVWEGTRIDGDIYINMREKPNLRASLDNPSKCKLSINGRKYSDVNSTNISLVMLMIPYQLNYNIYKYRLENAIAKSKDLVAVFDINAIPTNHGIDMDKWLYYVDALGIAWVDYSKEGVTLNPQHQTVLDMSIKTIASYIQLLESIKFEADELTGVNRQRRGQTSQYDLKSVTEQSIVQSSHITEDLFSKFGELEERDLQGLIDESKAAWIDGKKAQFVLPDQTVEYLAIDGIEHAEAEYGIFVTDSNKENQKIELVKQLGQALVQNGTPISAIVDIIDSNSFADIKTKIKQAEADLQKLAAAQAEAEAQAMQAQQQMEAAKLQATATENEKDRQNKLQIALIQAEAQQVIEGMRQSNPGETGTPDAEVGLKREELTQRFLLENRKLDQTKQLETRKLNLTEQDQKADQALREKEIAVKKIAANKKPSGSTTKK